MRASRPRSRASLLAVALLGGCPQHDPAAVDGPPASTADLLVLAEDDLRGVDPTDRDLAPARDLSAPADLSQPPDLSLPRDLAPCAVPGAKRLFVTGMSYSGNLKAAGGGASGLDGADKLCNLHATAAGLGGTFRAWLSDSGTDAFDRIADVGPWYLPDRCTKVFDNKAAIVAAGPRASMNVSESGAMLVVSTWTGTLPTGRKDGFTCKDWTNDQPVAGYEGTIGSPSGGARFWTEVASNPCRLKNALYCFEQ